MTTEALRIVGTPLGQVEGPDKVSGACDYAADITLPGMLYGKTLRSPYPHARILRINDSRARAYPGVRAVITAADVPQVLVGLRIRDVPILATDRVRFIGEKVAAVAADDPDTAERALSLIEVEYEELPAVFDPLEAIKQGAPILHDDPAAYEGALLPVPDLPNASSRLEIAHGDIEQGFAESDRIFEHTFRLAGTHQGYIEPHACVVAVGADGSAEVWATNKAIYGLRTILSEALELSEDQVRVYTTHVGGDFGGKQSTMDIPLAYVLAQRTGRPVKMVMSYAEELTAGNIRHPAVITLRTGVKSDGRLWAQDAHVIYNSGAYAGFKPGGNLGGYTVVGGSYRMPHVRSESLMVYTNTVPGGFMRTPGVPQMIFAVESQIDIIARELGMDPVEFRRLNALREGDRTATGSRYEQIRCLETIDLAATASGWNDPKPRPAIGRGMALYNRNMGGMRAGTLGTVTLTLDDDLRVTVHTALPDQGTGTYTVVRQVVAEVLDLAPSEVSLQTESTAEIPPESGIGGSKSTHITGRAAYHAAEELRNRLLEAAAALLDIYPEDIEIAPGGFRPRGDSNAPPAAMLDFATVAAEALRRAGGPVAITHTYTPSETLPRLTNFCAQVAEVEVDRETGQVTILKLVSAHDVGTLINPMMHQGQIDGGVIQALGYALMEELQVEDGAVVNGNLGDYKLPTVKDIPELTTALLEPVIGPVPFGGKSIAEIPNVPLAAAIANAVHDAVGVRISSLPITAEKVYNALHEKA